MAEYRISGVWVNSNNVITHYAFHVVDGNIVYRVNKKTKAEAISLLEKAGNSAKTWLWNYQQSKFEIGQTVEVVNGSDGICFQTATIG